MSYSDRAAQWAQNFYKDHHPTITWVSLAERIDRLIADVRRDALEEAALTIDEILIACECGSYHPLDKVAGALRVLKDRP